MKIGIIGSSMVAQLIAPKLLETGNEVMISSRTPDAEKDLGGGFKFPSANAWSVQMKARGLSAYAGSFSEAASFGELLWNATSGSHSGEALSMAGLSNFGGKILIDLSNPLNRGGSGGPVSLSVCNTDSNGERIQKLLPDTKVVKALNHVSSTIMASPGAIGAETDLLICGNDEKAKKWVVDMVLKGWFGWKNVIDLGSIECSRSMEMYLPLWVNLWGIFKTSRFNFKFIAGPQEQKPQ